MHRIVKMLNDDPKLTARELAEMSGTTRANVYQVLRKYGLKAAVAPLVALHETRKPASERRLMLNGSFMTSSFRGDISEYAVVRDFMVRGYHVYKSATGNAPFDMVAYDGKTMLRVEVRSGKRDKAGTLTTNHGNKDLYDVLAVVEIGGEITYYPRLTDGDDPD